MFRAALSRTRPAHNIIGARMNERPIAPRPYDPRLDLSRIETALAGRGNFPRRPSPPRSLISQAGTLGVLLSFNSPADPRGVIGYRIYQDTENNLVAELPKGGQRQHFVRLSSSQNTMLYVSSVS